MIEYDNDPNEEDDAEMEDLAMPVDQTIIEHEDEEGPFDPFVPSVGTNLKEMRKQSEQEKLLSKSFLQQNSENMNKNIERPPLRPLSANEGI